MTIKTYSEIRKTYKNKIYTFCMRQGFLNDKKGLRNGGGSNGARKSDGIARIYWENGIEGCNGTPPPDTE
jgi:hypothetical protein